MFLRNFLMSSWFESWHRRHIVWVEFAVIFLLCSSESFSVCLFVFSKVGGRGGGGAFSRILKNQHSIWKRSPIMWRKFKDRRFIRSWTIKCHPLQIRFFSTVVMQGIVEKSYSIRWLTGRLVFSIYSKSCSLCPSRSDCYFSGPRGSHCRSHWRDALGGSLKTGKFTQWYQ